MGKRLIDVVLAALLIIVTTPLFVLVSIVVRVFLGRPVLFTQQRPGRHAAPFTIYKFRTMRPPFTPGGELQDEEQRLTRVGQLLRSLSLDELPELFNVLKGDMSLVGPRPLLSIYLDRYAPEQARRHEVRPGITGWAQVNGRNDMSWERKFELDVYYVDHHNAAFDLKILVRTVGQVFRRSGISERGQVTSSEFLGTAALQSALPEGGPR